MAAAIYRPQKLSVQCAKNIVVDFARRRRHVEDSLDQLQLCAIGRLGQIPEFLERVCFDQGRGRDHHGFIVELRRDFKARIPFPRCVQ